MYIHIYLVRLGNHQDVFVMVSVVDIIQHLLWFPSSCLIMVSVLAANVCLWFPSLVCYGFRRVRKRCCYGFRRRIVDGFCRRRRIQHFRMYRVISFLLLLLGLVSVAVVVMVSVVARKHIVMVSIVAGYDV